MTGDVATERPTVRSRIPHSSIRATRIKEKYMENTSNPCHLRLEVEITIFTAAETKERLLEPLSRCPQVDVDLS